MRNKTFFIIMSVLLWGAMLTMASCMKDDRSNCEMENVRITVKIAAEVESAVNRSEINNVCLFVFDEQEHFIGKWAGEANIHDEVYDISLNLDPGIYSFVVWTNEGDIYKCNSSVSEMRSGDMTYSLNFPKDNIFGDNLPDLHYGSYTGARVESGKSHVFPVYLTPNTYTVNFTVKGLPVDDHSFDFTIWDDVSTYNFENSIVDDGNDYTHIRSAEFEDKQLTASFKVLSLTNDRQPMFSLDNTTTQTNLHADDLVEMIRKAYRSGSRTVDFDSIFEFDIILRFDSQLGVTISVNGWTYSPDETPIG